jgi:hypothetical protein
MRSLSLAEIFARLINAARDRRAADYLKPSHAMYIDWGLAAS